MIEIDALPFALSLAALPIAAVIVAHYVLWDLDKSLAKAKSVSRNRRP